MAKASFTDQAVQLLKLLEQRKGLEMDILKEEDGDVDKISMNLGGAELLRNPGSDGDVSGDIVLLYGAAVIVTDSGREPVPGDSYEIPLQSSASVEEEGDGIRVHTERALYVIRPTNG